ncbi:MAG: diguanylate cyclase [Planctomycetota bacterium]
MTSSLILLCDHRGAGLDRRAPELAARGFRVAICRSLRRSVAQIEEERPALILLDPLSPGGAVELQALDEAREGTPPVPLLIVAADEGGLDALAAARHLVGGAWDVVWRTADLEELFLRIERLEHLGHLLAEMGELRHRASHDDRTDLLRPAVFQKRLVEHFSAAERHRFSLGLVLIDLDGFGAINKRHDHTVGDVLIAQVGDAIRRTLRKEDVAGRLGGDEFAVLLPYTQKIDAARVVGRLRDEIRQLSGRPAGAKSEIAVSASLGFETFDGTDLDSVHTLRRHAERALRAAKLQGGDQGIYYRTLAGPDAVDGDKK